MAVINREQPGAESLDTPHGFFRRAINSVLSGTNRLLAGGGLAAVLAVGVAGCDKDGDEDTADTFSQIENTTGGITTADMGDESETEGESETDGGSDGSDSDSEGSTGGEDTNDTTGDDSTMGEVTGDGSTSTGMDTDDSTTEGPEINPNKLGHACLNGEIDEMEEDCSNNNVTKGILPGDNIVLRTVGIDEEIEINGVCVVNMQATNPTCQEAVYDEVDGVWRAMNQIEEMLVEEEHCAYTYVVGEDGRVEGDKHCKKYIVTS